jgi:hypothetical protein
MANLLG